jgi:cardiolipin synthase
MADSNVCLSFFGDGNETFSRMLKAINSGALSIGLEIYIYKASGIGDRFRDALIRAAQRGVRVRVLLDSFGSVTLQESYWGTLRKAGGELRWFNPLSLHRFNIRDHRKLLVCDSQTAFVGGFNIAPEWEGDGVTRGWRDSGLEIRGPLVRALSDSFDEMFARAEFKHKRFVRLRKRSTKLPASVSEAQLLLSGPGRGPSPIKRALRSDFKHARDVRIIQAYFLPPRTLRRSLMQVVRRGGRVQLILPGKSDIPMMQSAGRSLYARLLRAGIEIYEYQPQILHSKLIIVDQIAYIGSANLDTRSLSINYELLVRIPLPQVVAQAREMFAKDLARSKRIEWESWRRSRTVWSRLKERWAYLFFAKLDPYIAGRQWKALE